MISTGRKLPRLIRNFKVRDGLEKWLEAYNLGFSRGLKEGNEAAARRKEHIRARNHAGLIVIPNPHKKHRED